MNYNHIFDKYQINKDNLINYGFSYDKDKFYLTKQVEDFYLRILIKEGFFDAKLYDINTNEEYFLFNTQGISNSYLNELKSKVETEIEEIVLKCLEEIDIKSLVVHHILEKFNVEYEKPWDTNPNFMTFKTKKNNKWFAIIMDIPYKSLKIEKEGIIDLINIKLKPGEIQSLIDNINYFPAYHMNKKHWITIFLNKNTDLDTLKELIEKSYKLVENIL